MPSRKNTPRPPIPQQDKDHLKAAFAEFLSHKKYRELDSGWLHESEMMIALCAAHGKFDFSVVLEHFDELESALKFIGNPAEFMTWKKFTLHSAAYYLLDCPLLNLTVPVPNDLRFIREHLETLLFSPQYGSQKMVFAAPKLPEALQKVLDKNNLPGVFKQFDNTPQPEKLVAPLACAALLKEKWEVFAGLCARYDLSRFLEMEKLFEFWSKNLLSGELHAQLTRKNSFDFKEQWAKPEEYPLHRLVIGYGRERCVPVLYHQGFLTPEVITELWENGISFDEPLTEFDGWEKLTFPAFAAFFGSLVDKFDLIPQYKYPSRGDLIFRQNLKAAAFFCEYSAAHPRQAAAVKSAPPVVVKKGDLTPEQKRRLAYDEAHDVEFSANKRMLKRYTNCLDEPDEWKEEYVVPDFVTAIGAGAFSEIDAIEVKSIVLPEGLTKIGPRAFQYCQIEKVVFPSSLKTIGKEAFAFTELKEVRLPDGLQKIEEDAFVACSELRLVELSETTDVAAGAFGGASPELKIIRRKPKKQA